MFSSRFNDKTRKLNTKFLVCILQFFGGRQVFWAYLPMTWRWKWERQCGTKNKSSIHVQTYKIKNYARIWTTQNFLIGTEKISLRVVFLNLLVRCRHETMKVQFLLMERNTCMQYLQSSIQHICIPKTLSTSPNDVFIHINYFISSITGPMQLSLITPWVQVVQLKCRGGSILYVRDEYSTLTLISLEKQNKHSKIN